MNCPLGRLERARAVGTGPSRWLAKSLCDASREPALESGRTVRRSAKASQAPGGCGNEHSPGKLAHRASPKSFGYGQGLNSARRPLY